MKAIILESDCQCVVAVTLPTYIEEQYHKEGADRVWDYLHQTFCYGEFTPFILVDDECPIYDCSEDKDEDEIGTPIYVIR